MKKKLAIGMAAVMILGSLTGCGNSASQYMMDVDYSKYVKLCDYKDVEADNVTFEVTDDEVQEQIESEIYEKYTTYDVITDRGAEVGDYVMITYDAKIDGKAMEDYSGEDEEILLGEGYMYDEVEDALVGAKTGDKINAKVKLTEENAEEEDAGKTLELEVTVGDITQENTPEYNEEFVKNNTDYDSIEKYEASIKELLISEKQEEYTAVTGQQVLDFIVDNSEYNGYPEELYTECEGYFEQETEMYASMYGMSVEDYEKEMGLDEDTKKEQIEFSVHYELVIGALAQQQKIKCSKSEVQKFAKKHYAEYECESVDEFFENYEEKDVGYQIIYEKIMKHLYDSAKLIDISEEEYMEREGGMFDFEDGDEVENEEDSNDGGTTELEEIEGGKLEDMDGIEIIESDEPTQLK